MRRIIAFIALVFVLAGCSKAFEPKPKDVAAVYKNDFSVKAKATYGENETDFKITKNGMSISFVVESPKELSGLSIALSDEHAKVDFEGMELLLETENLPEKAPFFLVEELFENLSDEEDFTLSTDKNSVLAKGENFSAILSPEDFLLESAAFSEYKTEFSFSEWEFYAEE